MNSTFANIFVTAASQAAAQEQMGDGFFTAPLSKTGEPPATHYWSTGYFLDSELDTIVNDATWPRTIKFGDASDALTSMGLQPVAEPVAEATNG